MGYLTIRNILSRYNNDVMNLPNNYTIFIRNAYKQVRQTKIYKLKGVLSIEQDTELTPEVLNAACELYENTITNTKDSDNIKNRIEEINADFETLQQILDENKRNTEIVYTGCCGCTDEVSTSRCTDEISTSPNIYLFYGAMNDENKKAMDIWQSGGIDAAIKHMTTGSDGQPRDYATMRAMYG